MIKKTKIFLLAIIFLTILNKVSFGTNSPIKEEEEDTEQKIIYENIKIKDTENINKADTVVLLALNKITAKSYTYEVKVGEIITFERLIINPLFCWKSSPADIPENKALLKIVENKLDKTQGEIFYGWMFSSSPGISSLEHPMYDITLIDCKQDKKL